MALQATRAEHRFYGHLWVWMAGATFLFAMDMMEPSSDRVGLFLSLIWGVAVFLHYRRARVTGRRRFLVKHGAALEELENEAESFGPLRQRLLEGLDGARGTLAGSSQETLVGLAMGEQRALGMVAWLMDAHPLLAAQRSVRRERRRVRAQLALPGQAEERVLFQDLLTLLDANERRLRRVEAGAKERQDRIESFLLAMDSTQIALLSSAQSSQQGELPNASKRVGLLEQALEHPGLGDPVVELKPAARPSKAGDTARIRHEVVLARELQLSLLPSTAPDLPGLEVAHYYRPCSELGGDFYDFYAVPAESGEGKHLWIAVGDASGHGLDSSMVSSMAKSALYMQVSGGQGVASAMGELNRMMCDTLGRRRMMTLALLDIEVATGRGRWSNAGQLYPLLCRGEEVHELAQPGYPLGVRRQHHFAAAEFHLQPGDQLVLLTDGLIEAEHGGEVYGWPRLLDVLAKRPDGNAESVVDHLLEDWQTHMGMQDPQDDVTLLVLSFQRESS